MNKTNIIIIILLVAIGGFFVWQRFFRDDFGLPKGGDTESAVVVVQDGQIVETRVGDTIVTNDDDDTDDSDGVSIDTGEGDLNMPASTQGGKQESSFTTKEILITDGVKHSVPLNEIRGGGPPRDGIPSIDNPKFVSIADANDWFTDEEPGIAVEFNGINRFYPFQILVWHEIVNDTFNGQRVLVTYCPLCLSGIVFDPVVQGERVEFGTSGKLWNSNLVMYDRKTETLWSQVLGEAIVGELTGTELKILSSDQIKFGNWKKLHPNSEVLSRDTGAFRQYGSDPYGDYYTTSGVYFPLNNRDDRLAEKDFILGIVIEGQAKAYYPPAIAAKGEIVDTFAGRTIIAQWESDIEAVRLFEKKADGTLERINPFANFWFSWVAVHPDTELYK